MEGCSGLANAPKLWLFRSVHKVAHDREQRAAQNDNLNYKDMRICSSDQ